MNDSIVFKNKDFELYKNFIMEKVYNKTDIWLIYKMLILIIERYYNVLKKRDILL